MSTHDEPAGSCDVLIMGGGLAGLTLALQLRQRHPALDIQVLERRRHPVPEACHKVGESTVEIGAHYFAEVLGLREHLEQRQLRKFGFRFFFNDGIEDFAAVTELGASEPLPVISYQIDRGLFENFLGQEVQRRGIGFHDDAVVRGFDLAEEAAAADDTGALHTVRWRSAGGEERISRARWLIDASGRAGLIKKRLGLGRENAHAAHAVWFRIADRLPLDEWCDDPAWRARCVTPTRWRSTNHLCGAGYWVWLIPLASGSHSVGIVADPAYHPLERMGTFDAAMQWLAEHQPRLHAELELRRDRLQDFAFFRRFSYDCTQTLSAGRWAMTGEAGRFLDPFYSPGSDFIGMGNTLVCELIARDLAGQRIAAHATMYDQILRSFYDSTLELYVDQYGLFGDPEVMPLKVLWDYAYYWSVPAQLAFQQRLGDLASLARLRDVLAQCQRLNTAVQPFFREVSAAIAVRGTGANPPRMLDQASLPWFVELNRGLEDTLDAAGLVARIRDGAWRLRVLATQLLDWGRERGAEGEHAAALVRALEAAGGPCRGEPSLLFPQQALRAETALAA